MVKLFTIKINVVHLMFYLVDISVNKPSKKKILCVYV